MMFDSMEFFDVYRSRGLAGPGDPARPGRGRAPRPRRRHPLPRLFGRVLLASGQLLVLAGERLSAGDRANARMPCHG